MIDNASFRGRECDTKPVLGKVWRCSRFTLNVWDEFVDWAKTVLPDPLEVSEKAILRLQRYAHQTSESKTLDSGEKEFLLRGNAEQQERTCRLAMELANSYLGISSPPMRSLMLSPRGSARWLMLLLRKNHPEVTEEMAYEIQEALGEHELKRIMAVTHGKALPEGNGSVPAAVGAGRDG